MMSMKLGVWGGKYLFEHMHWRALKIMICGANENGMSGCEICLGNNHLKWNLYWNVRRKAWKNPLYVMVLTTQNQLRDESQLLCFCVPWFLFVCFRRKRLFYISILRVKKSAAGAWEGSSGGGRGLAGGNQMRNLNICSGDYMEETWG